MLQRTQHRLVETVQRPQFGEDGTVCAHRHSSQDEICRQLTAIARFNSGKDQPRPRASQTSGPTASRGFSPQRPELLRIENLVLRGCAIDLQPDRHGSIMSGPKPRCPISPLVRFIGRGGAEIK